MIKEIERQLFAHAPVALVHADCMTGVAICNLAASGLLAQTAWAGEFWPALQAQERAQRALFLSTALEHGTADRTIVVNGAAAPLRLIAAAIPGTTDIVISLQLADPSAPGGSGELHSVLGRAVVGARQGVWEWNVQSGEVYFSPQWKELIGFLDHELPNTFEAWKQRLHPDDAGAVLARVQRSLVDPASGYESEFRMLHKDGSWRWILASAAVQRDAGGTAVVMSGSHIDITRRKLVEVQSISDQRFVEQVLDNIPNLVFVKDAAGHFVLVNRAVSELFGVPKDQLVQRHNADVHDNAGDIALYDSIEAAVRRDGKTVVAEETFAPPGKEPRHYITTKMPLASLSGETWVLGVSVDVSEAKKVEAELRAAKEAAEAATRAKSWFVATVSHEIRTPLAGVLGTAELLLSTALTEEQRELAELSFQSARNLTDLVSDVLDFSRVEDGSLPLELVDLNLCTLVAELLDQQRSVAAMQGLELHAQLHQNVPAVVRGDPLRIRQVLLNLVANALKFTEQGNVVVSVRVISTTPQNAKVRFEVVDSGMGIAPESIAKLFQAFVQVDGSTKRRFEGSGLGLAICKRLVELMGGQIGVYSTLGAGSTFWFVLDLALSQAVSEPVREGGRPVLALERPAMATAPRHHVGRVLVVEDNAFNAVLLSRLLDKLGYAATVADSGTNAVIAAFQARYDAILMDIHMPGMDGFETTRAIRAREGSGTRVPIVAVTANAQLEARDEAKACGMDGFLTKPVDTKRLAILLARCTTGADLAELAW
jgi:PAS domain S-box-containing protein